MRNVWHIKERGPTTWSLEVLSCNREQSCVTPCAVQILWKTLSFFRIIFIEIVVAMNFYHLIWIIRNFLENFTLNGRLNDLCSLIFELNLKWTFVISFELNVEFQRVWLEISSGVLFNIIKYVARYLRQIPVQCKSQTLPDRHALVAQPSKNSFFKKKQNLGITITLPLLLSLSLECNFPNRAFFMWGDGVLFFPRFFPFFFFFFLRGAIPGDR